MSDSEISTVVSEESPQRACVKLVELAKERGGYDNITLAVIPVGGQIKQEPPMGYDETAALRQARSRSQSNSPQARGMLKNLAIVGVLSLLGGLLVVLMMVISLSK